MGQEGATASVAGVMLSGGGEVQLNELADSTDPNVTGAFLDGWSLTFLVFAAVTAVALFAAIRTKVYTADAELDSG